MNVPLMAFNFCKFLFGLHRKRGEGCYEKKKVLSLVIYSFLLKIDITWPA